MLDNLLNNSLAKFFNVSPDKVILHDIRFYSGTSENIAYVHRHMKFLWEAAGLGNILLFRHQPC
jgi:hypothetical protein